MKEISTSEMSIIEKLGSVGWMISLIIVGTMLHNAGISMDRMGIMALIIWVFGFFISIIIGLFIGLGCGWLVVMVRRLF
jgi:hypothetical protein